MAEKPSFGEGLDRFFEGKGFYIVLFLCVAVIGASAYFLFAGNGTHVEEPRIDSGYEDAVAPIHDDPELGQIPEYADDYELGATLEDPVLDEVTGTEETGTWTAEEAEAAISVQYIWPLEGEITLPYSVTALIYHEKLGDWRTHDGVAVSAPLGTQVVSVCAGKVERVYTDDLGGTTVIIAHAGGLRSIYANLAELPTVREGDSVMTGEVIGAVGATASGESKESPHLILKMTLDGQSINPADYLPPR